MRKLLQIRKLSLVKFSNLSKVTVSQVPELKFASKALRIFLFVLRVFYYFFLNTKMRGLLNDSAS